MVGMEQRALGTTELRVSAVTFGAMGLGAPGKDEDERRIAILHAALEEGVTAIDTAPLYGFGRSERVVARAISEQRPRPLVLTKVGLRWDDPSQHGEPLFRTRDEMGRELVVRRNSRPESILLEIERSLERLGVERLDLVQVHQRDHLVPIDETMGVLSDAVRAGTVRYVGVSNFSASEVLQARAALGEIRLASLQSEFNLLCSEVERRALRAVRRAGIGFLAYSPLAKGLLSGTYGPDRALDQSDFRSELKFFSTQSRMSIAAAMREVVFPIATRHGAKPAQIALAWALAHSPVSAVVVGASSVLQARQNAEAARIFLEKFELDELEAAFLRVRKACSDTRRVRVWKRAERAVRSLLGRAR